MNITVLIINIYCKYFPQPGLGDCLVGGAINKNRAGRATMWEAARGEKSVTFKYFEMSR